MAIKAYKTKKPNISKIKSVNKNQQLATLNWTLYKLEYFNLHDFSITAFLDSKGLLEGGKKMSGRLCDYTKGWRAEKIKYLSEKYQKSNREIKALCEIESSEILSPTINEKIRILNIISKRLLMAQSGIFVKMKDIKIMYEIIKTELGEPIKIIQNNNANVDVNELLNQINDSEKPIDPKSADQKIFGRPDIIDVEIDGVKLKPSEVKAVET